MLRMAISGYFATLGFGILFNIRGKKLLYAPLGATIGSIVYSISRSYSLHYFVSLLLTAIAFTMFSEIMSRVFKTPVTLFVISSTICFVPGGLMYNTMAEIIHGNLRSALSLGLEAIGSAMALAIGIMLASSLMRVIFQSFGKIKN